MFAPTFEISAFRSLEFGFSLKPTLPGDILLWRHSRDSVLVRFIVEVEKCPHTESNTNPQPPPPTPPPPPPPPLYRGGFLERNIEGMNHRLWSGVDDFFLYYCLYSEPTQLSSRPPPFF